jgi:O-succinylbenzoic acid--CoA ligase
MRRLVQPVAIPRNGAVLTVLPLLRSALAGDGSAILPIGDGDPRAGEIARELRAGEALDPAENDDADPTALVMTTSGSTGAPKGVLLSAGQLAASAAATEERLGGPGHWLLALPAQHIAGMQVLLRAARAGGDPLVMDLEKPFTASDFVIHARQLPGPRRYVSLVPTQLARILDDADATAATAEIFDAVLVGGSAVSTALLDTARRDGIPVVTTYGMTETCGGCVYDGVPLAGVSVARGTGGAIVLTGPMVARGYRGRPDDPAFATPRSFATSDAGEIGLDGTLLVLGRLDDVIISGGVNVAPGAVEAAIRALPGVTDALVVGVPDARWGQAVAALIVPAPGAQSWTAPRLRAALTEAGALPRTHLPHRAAAAAAIPQLASGKPDRRRAAVLLSQADTPG